MKSIMLIAVRVCVIAAVVIGFGIFALKFTDILVFCCVVVSMLMLIIMLN